MAAERTWLDRAISYLSPEAGMRRARARLKEQAYLNAWAMYDGASKGRRTKGWRRRSTDANAETRAQLVTLRDVSRDLVRNNAYAARAVSAIVNNVIGAGIVPAAKGRTERATKRLEALLREHLDTTAIDADGRHDLYGLEALTMRTVVESGEALVRRRRRFASDGLPLPFQIQVLEPDFLDTRKDGPQPGGNFAIQGVEFDPIGRRVAYWLFTDHPGSQTQIRAPDSRRVPASEIIHVYRMDRPGQVRGVPWGAPVMLRLHDFADFEEAQLVRQKIAACFAAFVYDVEDAAPVTGPANGQNPELLETLEPGIIETLPPGKNISFASPPGVEGYSDYANVSLHAIAAGFGVTYEALTGDLKGVNFSSGRMGWLEFARSIDAWRWQMFIPTFCRGVEAWVMEAALLSAGIDEAEWIWTPPRREMIDPTKEVPAKVAEIRAGLLSHPEAIRERGFDPDKVLEEIADWNRRLDNAGVILDTDPRKTARGGAPAVRQQEGQTQDDD